MRASTPEPNLAGDLLAGELSPLFLSPPFNLISTDRIRTRLKWYGPIRATQI
jgi:hypothetical protein